MRLLLVEDDTFTAAALRKLLVAQQYQVDVAATGRAGWELVEANAYDLLLLDWMLPELDGIGFCRQLRASQDGSNQRTPILLMTAFDSQTHRVTGLDAGADDYVVKPFDAEELLARIRALLRRGGTVLSSIVEWGNLQLDPRDCRITYQAQPLALTSMEYRMLELFLRNPRQVFSQQALIDRFWAFEKTPTEATVRAHIRGLRKKLRQVGAEGAVETVHGFGYRLAEAGESRSPAVRQSETLEVMSGNLPDAKTDADLLPLWEKHRQGYLERRAVLERAIVALQAHTCTEALKRQAQQHLHTLVGSLGSYGLTAASYLCREIEQSLNAEIDQLPVALLVTQVEQLKQLVEQGAEPGDDSSVVDAARSPTLNLTLMMIDDDAALAQALLLAAARAGVQATAIVDGVTAQRTIRQLCQGQIPPPDLLLLNLCFLGAADVGLGWLAALTTAAPTLRVIVFTAQQDLGTRVKAEQLGSWQFLPKPIAPAQVMAIAALDGQFMQVNAALCQWLGYSRADLLQKTLSDLIPADRREGDRDLRQQFLAGTIPGYHLEQPFQHQSGDELWGRIRVALVQTSGLPSCLTVQIQDRTVAHQTAVTLTQQAAALTRYEAELHQQSSILQSVLESVGDGIVVVDEQGNFLAFNPAAQVIYGTSAVEITPQQWVEPQQLLSPQLSGTQAAGAAALPSGKLLLLRALRGETADNVEVFVHRRHQQEGIWVSTTAKPLYDRTGKVLGGVLVIRNVSDRKQAEAILERQFQRTQLLKQITQEVRQRVPIQQILQTAISQAGAVFQVNRGAIYPFIATPTEAALFGLTLTDFPKTPCIAEYLAPGYASLMNLEGQWMGNPYLEQVLAQDEAIAAPNVYTIALLQGLEPFYQQIGLKSMLAVRTTYQGQINGIICLHQCDAFRDWTADELELLEAIAAQVGIALAQAHLLHQTEQQQQQMLQQATALQAAQQSVEGADRFQAAYLALFQWAIGLPMMRVMGSAAHLSQFALDPQQRHLLETIQTSRTHLLDRVHNILDLSRLESQTLILEPHPFSLRNRVEDCLDLLADTAADHGLTLVSLIAPDLPDRWLGDVSRLQQLLINLLKTAVALTASGTVSVTVEVEPHERDRLQFTIRAVGTRMANVQDMLSGDIFSGNVLLEHEVAPENSSSLLSDRTDLRLGWAISQRLAERMGGSLKLPQFSQQGLTIACSVPIAVCSESVCPQLEGADDCPDAVLNGKKLLIVEPHDLMRQSLTWQAQHSGMIVRAIPTAIEALNQLYYERFDAVVLAEDLMDIDGQSFPTELHQFLHDQRIPLILLRSLKQSTEPLLQFAAVLHLPTRHDQVHATLTQALREVVMKEW